MSKLLLLTLNEQEEKAIDKIIAAIADCISLEAVQTIPVPASRNSSANPKFVVILLYTRFCRGLLLPRHAVITTKRITVLFPT